MVDGWIHKNHKDAHLIEHADRKYKTNFKLQWSQRPWVQPSGEMQTISGLSGHIWHANWFFRGGRPFNPRGFWRDVEPQLQTILFICAESPSTIEMSFSAMEDPSTVADTIGYCFDCILGNLGYEQMTEDFTHWRQQNAGLDPRVQICTPWSSMDTSMQDVSLFGV